MVLWLFVMVILVALMIPLTAVILDSQVGRALAARIERDRPGLGDGMDRRLAVLEGEVDRMAREVQKLEEESAFLHSLLEDKRPREALPPGQDEG